MQTPTQFDYFVAMNEGLRSLTHSIIISHNCQPQKIRSANLHQNQLTNFDAFHDVFGHRTLEDLDVSSNLIRSLQGLHFERLTKLNVSSNLLEHVDGIGGAPCLLTFIANYNRIYNLSGMMGHPSLQSLHLIGNKIEDQQHCLSVLGSLRNLKALHLARGDGELANPVCSSLEPYYQDRLRGVVPTLTVLDGIQLTATTTTMNHVQPMRYRENHHMEHHYSSCDDDDSDSAFTFTDDAQSTITSRGMGEVHLQEDVLKHFRSFEHEFNPPAPTAIPAPKIKQDGEMQTSRPHTESAKIQTKPTLPPRRRNVSTGMKDIITPLHNMCTSQLEMMDALKQRLEDVNEEKDVLSREMVSVRTQWDHATKELVRISTKLDQMTLENTHLKEQKENAQCELVKMERALCQATSTAEQHKAMVAFLQSELEARISVSRQAEKENDDKAQVVMSRDRELLSKLTVVVKEQRTALMTAQQTIKTYETTNAAAQEKHSQNEMRVKQLETAQEEWKRKFETLQQEHAECEKEKSRLKALLSTTSAAHSASQHEFDEQTHELQQLREANAALQSESEGKSRAIHNLNGTIQDLQHEIENILRSERRYKQGVEELQDSIHKYKGYDEQHRATLHQYEEQAQKCKIVIEDLTKQCVKWKQAVEVYQQQLLHTQRELKDAKESEGRLVVQSQEMKSQIREMEEKNRMQRTQLQAMLNC